MGCITKKLRGYGFVAQMTQLPIVAIQRTKVLRSRQLLNVSHSMASCIYLLFADLGVEHIILDLYDTRIGNGKMIRLFADAAAVLT